MSVAEAVMEKLSALPPQKQEQVLHYVESLNRPAKTAATDADPYEWLKIAASMNLDGPPDMSEHLDDYLYRNGGNSKH
ncbi:MAG: hypothetical protein PHY43_05675 [Verrucomicrobiales bacterium]|nr:hypothetical protein [Verrucomicrobiales bacterium]